VLKLRNGAPHLSYLQMLDRMLRLKRFKVQRHETAETSETLQHVSCNIVQSRAIREKLVSATT